MANESKKVIKISPELDKSANNKLTRDVKKTFSSPSIVNALTSGFTKAGIAFAAAVGVGKILDSANALRDDVVSKITNRLSRADETVTRAGFYGVSAERLGRLEDIALATGIKTQAELYNAIDRFGNYIREAKANGVVGADTYSDNTFDAFIQFVAAMKKATPEVRNAEMYKALGRTGGRFADFVLSDWDAIEKRLGPATTKQNWEDMADLNDELDLQNVRYNRLGNKELADSLKMRNYAIERNLITNIQNAFDSEMRGVASTWARDIKRTVSTMDALRESVEAVTSVFNVMFNNTPLAPERHRQNQGFIIGMAMPKDNSSAIQQTKTNNQNKKGVND